MSTSFMQNGSGLSFVDAVRGSLSLENRQDKPLSNKPKAVQYQELLQRLEKKPDAFAVLETLASSR